jgi:ABC-2 type transport system ATP-binding protein
MIKISNLKKCFGEKTAVDIADFTINQGDILGLVGNNGAGKTTLFRLILDLLKADDGKVEMEFDETGLINPAESEEWKRLTGAFIDEGFLIEFLTPEEYFYFIGKVSGLSKEEVDKRLTTFEHFMNGEVLNQKKLIRDLSAGNKQKVGIISALLNRPQLVILDEPFNFLDPTSQNVIKHILVDYHRETNATILISSHNLAHTVDISPRIALLEHGVIIRDLPNENGSAERELEEYFNT